MEVAEIIILMWIYGVIRFDRITNKYIIESLHAMNIAGRMREDKLRRFGYVLRKVDNDGKGKNISEINVERNRGGGKE